MSIFATLQLVLQSPGGGDFLRIPLPTSAEDPKGDERTERTVAAMTAVVQSTRRTGIAAAALRSIAGPQRDRLAPEAVARLIYNALRDSVGFDPDPAKLEYLRHPDAHLYKLAMRQHVTIGRSFKAHGDCDDMAMLGCALLLAAGLRPVFITEAIAPPPRDRFVHVLFGFIDAGGNVVPMDPQERFEFGTMARPSRAKVWEVRPAAAFAPQEQR